MAGCVSCFVLPLLLFIFHRFIQPLILKFWNPWAKPEDKVEKSEAAKEDIKCDDEGLKYRKNYTIREATEANNDCCARG